MDPFGRGVDLQRMCFSVKMYVKTKELDPLGGACTGKFLYVDPPMIRVFGLGVFLHTTPWEFYSCVR